MGQSVYEIIEGNNNEAYAKLPETALQPEIGIDASSLGQLRDPTKVIPSDGSVAYASLLLPSIIS